MAEPTRPSNDPDKPPPAKVGPPPEAEPPPLGLDNAWERLSGTGRGVVVVLAMALVIGAGVGVGLLVGGNDDGGDGDQVVLAETASSVLTVEGPPQAETDPLPSPGQTETDFVPVPVPEATETDVVPVPVPEETETELVPVPVPEETETDLVPVPVPEATETVTEGVPTTGAVPGLPDDATVYTSQSPGSDVGGVTVDSASVITWTGGGQQFTLVDRASGQTLVDSSGAGGRVEIDAGEYDLEVTEGGEGWSFAITDA